MSGWLLTRYEWDDRYGMWQLPPQEVPTALQGVLRARERLRKQPPRRPFPPGFVAYMIRPAGRLFPQIAIQTCGVFIYDDPENISRTRFSRWWSLHRDECPWVIEREDWTPLWGVRTREVGGAECALRAVLIAREMLRQDHGMDVAYTVHTRRPETKFPKITVEREGLTIRRWGPWVDYKRRWAYIPRLGGKSVDRYFRKGDER